MKHRQYFRSLIFTLLVLLVSIQWVLASPQQSNLFQTENSNLVVLATKVANRNETNSFPISLTNTSHVAAAQIAFTYDSTIGLSIQSASTTSRSAGFQLNLSKNSSNPAKVKVTILLYNLDNLTITPGNGALVSIVYSTTTTAAGNTPLEFSTVLLSDSTGQALASSFSNGQLSIQNEVNFTPTFTPTGTATPSATATSTLQPTFTPTASFTASSTPTADNVSTATSTPTATNTPTSVSTPVTNGATIQIYPQLIGFELGQRRTFSVTVLPGNTQVNGVQVHGKVDPTYLKLLSVNSTQLLPQILSPIVFDESTGEFSYGAGLLNSTISTPFTVLIVEVEAIALTEPAGTAIEFLTSFPATDISGPAGSILAHSQAGQVTVDSSSALHGALQLQGRLPKPNLAWSIPLTVEWFLKESAEPFQTDTLVTDPNGEFTIQGLPSGEYELRIKGNHTLANRIENITLLAGSNDYELGMLLEGDVLPNNQIAIADFGPLSSALYSCKGHTQYQVNADLNESGCVQIDDIGLLSGNFNLQGDIPYDVLDPLPQPLLQPDATLGFGTEVFTVTTEGIIELPLYITSNLNGFNSGTAHFQFNSTHLEVIDVAMAPPLSQLGDIHINTEHNDLFFSFLAPLGQIYQGRTQVATLKVKVLPNVTETLISPSTEFPATDIIGGQGSILLHASGITLFVSPTTLEVQPKVFLPFVSR